MAGETDHAEQIEQYLSKMEANIEERSKEHAAIDRSLIGKSVVLTFVSTIIGLFVFVLLSAVFFDGGSAHPTWERPAEFLLRVLSSVLLPVVTLVIGYYFGTEKVKK